MSDACIARCANSSAEVFFLLPRSYSRALAPYGNVGCNRHEDSGEWNEAHNDLSAGCIYRSCDCVVHPSNPCGSKMVKPGRVVSKSIFHGPADRTWDKEVPEMACERFNPGFCSFISRVQEMVGVWWERSHHLPKAAQLSRIRFSSRSTRERDRDGNSRLTSLAILSTPGGTFGSDRVIRVSLLSG